MAVEEMDRMMLCYRGSLKSCNYHCSYCPFAKHRFLRRELERDKEEWIRFCRSLRDRAEMLKKFGLMVVPYGEALIHPWYWEGLGEISALKEAEAVGAQTNFSFSLNEAMKSFSGAGGQREKLRLWATFHPEMLSAEDFAGKCREAAERGIVLCAGAVGVPENIPLLYQLRRLLPDSVYLWINRMDRLKRSYSPEEERAFSEIDPFFVREQVVIPAEPENCHNRLLVEGNGRLHTCNISPALPENWYQEDFHFPLPFCRQKNCSCYLAYGGREDWVNFLLFGRYPLFRIPRRFSAVFLDIDGTLIPEGKIKISSLTQSGIRALARAGSRLFFATSLPLPEARRKCRKIWGMFSGGVFAGGAHLWWREGQKIQEIVYPLKEEILEFVRGAEEELGFRLFVCRKKKILYKITLSRHRGCCWNREEEKILQDMLPEMLKKTVRFIREENCMQIVPAEARKEKGMAAICRKLGISLEETGAVGNSAEDDAMLDLCCEGLKFSGIK